MTAFRFLSLSHTLVRRFLFSTWHDPCAKKQIMAVMVLDRATITIIIIMLRIKTIIISAQHMVTIQQPHNIHHRRLSSFSWADLTIIADPFLIRLIRDENKTTTKQSIIFFYFSQFLNQLSKYYTHPHRTHSTTHEENEKLMDFTLCFVE